MKRFIGLLILVGLLLCGCALSDKRIKQIAAKEFDVPADKLKILACGKAGFRWSGREVTTAKLVDIRNDKGYDLTIDADKQGVDKKKLIRENQESFSSKYGKIEPELFRLLSESPKMRQKVGIWFHSKPRDVKSSDRAREKVQLSDIRLRRKKLHQAAVAENQKRLRQYLANLEMEDIRPLYVCKTAPLVFVEANASRIKSVERSKDVEFIYLARVGRDLLNTAVPTVAGSAWPTTQFEGNGVRIAIVEDDGIDFSNPFLAPADGGSFQPDTTNLGHPTQTAGVAASRHAVYRGMAPQATLVSGTGGTYDANDIIAATDWAVGAGDADVVNCSFGFSASDTRHDLIARYYDHIVWNEWRIVTPAAGNSPGSTVLAPGVAFNVLTVGGIDDADTPWHNDDGMYVNTSGMDPPSPHGDREKPEVCAVATGILSTEDAAYQGTNGQWITLQGAGHAGTSYAAPAVAGAIARLIDRKGYLFTWPEESKAIIMASAVRPVDDATVDTDNSTVDVEEGVGTVVVPLAEKIVSQGWHHGTHLTSSSFPYNYHFDAEEGDIVRFVVCWDAHTDSAYTTVGLEADLDLHVYDPGGTRVAYSVSWDNSYEIVEFTAPATGQYRAWIRDWRFDGTYEWVGLAWSRR